MNEYKKTREFLKVLFPNELEENEYITLFVKGNFKKKVKEQIEFWGEPVEKESKFNVHCKNIDEAINNINKYKHNFNIFVCLATTDGKGRTKDNLKTRRAIAFDFDKKDFNNIKELNFYIDLIRNKVPGLYYHMIVDSGNGYHFYCITEATEDNERITNINKIITDKLGADEKARLETQVLRVPGTRNLKEVNNPKNVSLVTNNTTKENFKLHMLNDLERRFCKEIKTYNGAEKPINFKNLGKELTLNYEGMSCIDNMLKASVIPKGHRNFCLGRITNYLKIKGYTEGKALEFVLNWNSYSCIDPKDIEEVKTDFKSYWDGNYKLLGCSLADERLQQILHTYCNKEICNYIIESGIDLTEEIYQIDNKYLEVQRMRNLTGNHYVVLSMLLTNEPGLTREEITNKLTPRRGKCCISKPTMLKVLNELASIGYIKILEPKLKNEPYLYKIKDTRHWGQGYTRMLYSSSLLRINNILSPKEYLVYLYLARNIQLRESMTLEKISNDLDMQKKNVITCIRALEHDGLLRIEKKYNDKGHIWNKYYLYA